MRRFSHIARGLFGLASLVMAAGGTASVCWGEPPEAAAPGKAEDPAAAAAPAFDRTEAGVARGTLAIKKARAAYVGLKTYRDRFVARTIMEFEKPVPGMTPGPQESKGTLSVSRPGRIACVSDQTSIYSDGSSTTIHVPMFNQYRVMEGAFTTEKAEEEPMLDGFVHPCLRALLSGEGAPDLLIRDAKAVEGSRSQERGGRAGTCVLLRVEPSEMELEKPIPIEVWIDDQTSLVGAAVIDYTEVYRAQMAEMNGGDEEDAKDGEQDEEEGGFGPSSMRIKTFRMEVEIQEPVVDGEVPADAFVFKPGSSDKKVDEFDYGGGGLSESQPDLLLGEAAPEIEGTTVEGKAFKLSDLKGRVVVLDFWATWCGPCMQAIPHVQKLHEEFKDKAVTIVGINQDMPGSDDAVKEALEKKHITFTQVMGADTAGEDYLVSGIPHMVILDKDGKVAFHQTGFSPGGEKKIAANVEKLLAGESIYTPEEIAAKKQAAKEGSEGDGPGGPDEDDSGSAAPIAEQNPERLVALEPLKARQMFFSAGMGGTTADVDFDGKPECVFQQMGSSALTIISSDGSAVRTVKLEDLGANSQISSIGVVNAGGEPRFLVCSSQYTMSGSAKARVRLYSAEGKSLWSFAPELAKGHTCTLTAVARNLTGDDAPEIIVGMSTYKADTENYSQRDMHGYVAVLGADGGLQSLRRVGMNCQHIFVANAQPGQPVPILVFADAKVKRFVFDPAATPK